MNVLIQKSKVLFDSFWCKMFFVILPFFSEIPILMPYMVPLMKLGLVWACICIVYDFFDKRNILKMRYMSLIFVFLVCLAISVVLNLNNSLARMNIIEFFYTVAVLVVLYPTSAADDEKNTKEITIINYTLSVLTFIVAVVSLFMFVTQYKYIITVNDYNYTIGFSQGRLVGLYKNAIYPTAAFGIWCPLSQLLINSKRNVGKTRLILSRLFLISCIVVSLIFVTLQNSKGIFIGCMVTMSILVFFSINYLDTKKFFKDKKHLQYMSAIIAITVCLGVFSISLSAIRSVASYSVIKVAESTDRLDKLENVVIEDGEGTIDFDREVPSEYGFATGRGYIWKQGLNNFFEKPLFGYGPYSLSGTIETYPGSTEKVSHFHNVFVHVLVSCGILGFMVFIALCVLVALQILKFMFTTEKKNFIEVLGVASLIIFLLVINLADTTILFQTKHSEFIFFIYLGYIVSMTSNNETVLVDKPIRLIDNFIEKTLKNLRKDAR